MKTKVLPRRGEEVFFGGRYRASESGDIFFLKSGKKLSSSIQSNGYYRVTLDCGLGHKIYYVHRVIAAIFVDNPMLNNQVNHINGIKSDNRRENLEWVTPRQNMDHAKALGLLANKAIKAKITDAEVAEILDRLKSGQKVAHFKDKYSAYSVGTLYGIKQGRNLKRFKRRIAA